MMYFFLERMAYQPYFSRAQTDDIVLFKIISALALVISLRSYQEKQ